MFEPGRYRHDILETMRETFYHRRKTMTEQFKTIKEGDDVQYISLFLRQYQWFYDCSYVSLILSMFK